MKKLCYLLILLVIGSSCRKDKSTFVDAKPGVASTEGNYQPGGKGSYWKYSSTNDLAAPDVVTDTYTGKTVSMSGMAYNELTTRYESDSPSDPDEHIYYFHSGNRYWLRGGESDVLQTADIEYLRDNVPVNTTWEAISGGFKYIGVIKEKDISKTVSGKTYKKVIHSQVRVLIDYGAGNGYEAFTTLDMYCADGVGTIQTDEEVNFMGLVVKSRTELTDYSIK